MKERSEKWTAVDAYFTDLFKVSDDALEAALAANQAAGLPAIDVSPNQGKFLSMLARMSGARRILEIGTLGGYSTIWLARAVQEGGRVVTLELNPKHAEVARANLAHAGVAELVEIRVGPAIASLDALASENVEPFDFIFIDADKLNYPHYLAQSLALSRPGTVIVGDNVVRAGEIVNPASDDPNVPGVRVFSEMIARAPRLTATAIQTVGVKGYDGFAIAIVTS